jgi:hypothetical protein
MFSIIDWNSRARAIVERFGVFGVSQWNMNYTREEFDSVATSGVNHHVNKEK